MDGPDSNPIALTAVLLAGGRSVRMGSDKALVQVDGQPLWRRQLATLQALNTAELVVSGARRSGFPPDLRNVEDEGASRGPLSGLGAALEFSSQPHVLVLAIDLPWMTPAFLRELCAQVPPGRGIVPFRDGPAGSRRFYEPLAAIYPRGCLDAVRRRLAGEDWSLQEFVREGVGGGWLAEINIPAELQPLFRNVNSPDDLSPG